MTGLGLSRDGMNEGQSPNALASETVDALASETLNALASETLNALSSGQEIQDPNPNPKGEALLRARPGQLSAAMFK